MRIGSDILPRSGLLPVRRCRKTLGTSLLAVCFALGVLAFGCSGTDQQSPPTLSAQQQTMQKERLAFIQKMVDQGVFQKMEKSELWVTQRFYGLDFDTKSKIVGVAYAYYITENPKSKIIHLVDNRTGKLIGKFSENAGGLALD